MLNSIGLPNPGLDGFAATVLPAVRALGRPLVVSIGGFEHADYELACRRLDGEAGIAALELNVSCPNVKSGCISIGSDPAETEAVVRLCRAATRLPLWVKLSPNVADLAAIALRRRARRRRRARAHEHAARRSRSTTGRSSRCSAASRAGSPARRSSPWRWRRSTPAARPARSDRRRRRASRAAGMRSSFSPRAQAPCRSAALRSASRCSRGASATELAAPTG